MPSPPITIGELHDVPAFNSPIQSPWAQEVSRRVVHRFATIADLNNQYPAATAGVGAVAEVAGVLYISDGTYWMGGHFGIVANWTPSVPLGNGSFQNMVGWTQVSADGFSIDAATGIFVKTYAPLAGTFSYSFWVTFSTALTTFAETKMTYTGGLQMDFLCPAGGYHVFAAGTIRIPAGAGSFVPQVFLHESTARSGSTGRFELHRTGP